MPHGACAWCSYTRRGGRAWSPVGMYIMLLTARKSWPALGSPTRVHLSAPGHPRVRRPAAFLFVPPPPLPVGLRSARQPCAAWTRWPHERVGAVGARRALDQHTHLMSVPRPAAAGDALQPADCASRACRGAPSECGARFFGSRARAARAHVAVTRYCPERARREFGISAARGPGVSIAGRRSADFETRHVLGAYSLYRARRGAVVVLTRRRATNPRCVMPPVASHPSMRTRGLGRAPTEAGAGTEMRVVYGALHWV